MVQEDVLATEEPLDEAEDERAGRTRRKLGGLIAFALLLSFVVWWILANTVVVPSVVGLSEQAAAEKFKAAGLDVGEVSTMVTREQDEGDVAAQAPPVGARVLLGDEIDVALALRPGAEDAVDGVGDGVGVGAGEPEGTKGYAADSGRQTAPRPKTQPAPRTYSSKTAAEGVPTAQALTESEARSVLRAAGYDVVVKYGPSSAGPGTGRVFFQEPAPGALVYGATVEIWISTGPPPSMSPHAHPTTDE